MLFLQTCIAPNPFSPLSAANFDPKQDAFSSISHMNPISSRTSGTLRCSYAFFPSYVHHSGISKSFTCFSVSREPNSDPEVSSKLKSEAVKRSRRRKTENSQNRDESADQSFPTTIPRKPRRGRRSEAVAVGDFIRDKLEQTFESIREKDPELFLDKEKVLKDRVEDDIDSEDSDGDVDDEVEDGDGKVAGRRGRKMVVEEEDPDWPLDADVGWGVRASEYFDQHPIKNVVGEDGFEVDWEGEIDDSWVKEINCLEWESFAFHPSPLIVLVFERYDRASHNWKTLKELENAIKVYWNAKDRLPPRAVKLDINIERDLAYALKANECPQILFLRGNKILYREKEFRTADELVQMIAHFYYNAKRPSWIDEAARFSSY
ncbi:hypothetical protein SLA2020_162930 [Shorea laevis]